jgi:hypothetical protein
MPKLFDQVNTVEGIGHELITACHYNQFTLPYFIYEASAAGCLAVHIKAAAADLWSACDVARSRRLITPLCSHEGGELAVSGRLFCRTLPGVLSLPT